MFKFRRKRHNPKSIPRLMSRLWLCRSRIISVCPSVCLSIHPSIPHLIHLSLFLSLSRLVQPSIYCYMYIPLPKERWVYYFINVCVCPSVCLSVTTNYVAFSQQLYIVGAWKLNALFVKACWVYVLDLFLY